MKVDNLLGPYLYQYKKLSLPGIGLFTLDDKAVLPDENSKIKIAIEGISFTTKTGPALDDSLIQYIKDNTGKMRALAEADLYSFIGTAFQYLNIGKPYYFEGIGTLQKNKDNGYSFTAGTVIHQKADDIPHKHVETKRKDSYASDDAVGGRSFNGGKLVIALVVLVTLALIGWGGYYLYNKNTAQQEPEKLTQQPVAAVDTTTVAVDSSGKKPDSINSHVKTDSAIATPAAIATATATPPPAGSYKFIFETTAKKIRAVKRFEQIKDIIILKDYSNKAAVETKDSLSFKIYTIVSCIPADTARVKQLLNAWYYGSKEMKVKIEQ